MNLLHPSKSWLIFLGAVLFVFVFAVPEAFAGPGGEVVELVFKTKIGRILFGIAAVILLPLILYVIIREHLGIKRTRKDLESLAETEPFYDWDELENRIIEGANALYGCWSNGNLAPASKFLTPDFQESQQDILDRWADEGKKNVCRMEHLKGVAPLYVVAGSEFSYPVVAAKITLDLVDFMLNTKTNDVIKGKQDAHEGHDVIWIMTYDGSEWLLHSIEDGSDSLVYAKMKNEITPISSGSFPSFDEESDFAGEELPPVEPAQEVIPARVQKPDSEEPQRQPE